MLAIGRSKHDRNAIIFHMDKKDAESISSCFDAARNGECLEIEASLELTGNCQSNGSLAIKINENERIEFKDKKVK